MFEEKSTVTTDDTTTSGNGVESAASKAKEEFSRFRDVLDEFLPRLGSDQKKERTLAKNMVKRAAQDVEIRVRNLRQSL